jgi:hypothetical protein
MIFEASLGVRLKAYAVVQPLNRCEPSAAGREREDNRSTTASMNVSQTRPR